jgi:hypothetical protein
MMSGSGMHDFTERKRRIDSVPMSFRCYVSLQGFVSFSWLSLAIRSPTCRFSYTTYTTTPKCSRR